MKVLLQRVSKASVSVDDHVMSSIQAGLLVLLGITHTDTRDHVEKAAIKICDLRIFADEQGKMNRSIKESQGEILLVSQFTLYGNAQKGRRPSFVEAASPDHARPLYDYFIDNLNALGVPTQTGKFGHEMKVHLVNDGPVTLMLEF